MNNIETFFYFKISNIDVVVFNSDTDNTILNKKIELEKNYDDIEILINELNKKLKELIIEVEIEINQQLNKIILIIDDPFTLQINACIKKNFDKSVISKEQIEYLIQDLNHQILKESDNIKINHIIVNEFLLDGQKILYPPINKKCEDLVLEVQFICFQKKFITSLENLFKNHQIEFSYVLCANYTKSNFNKEFNSIFDAAIALKNGYNSNEVSVISKKQVKMGFFERFFHIFS